MSVGSWMTVSENNGGWSGFDRQHRSVRVAVLAALLLGAFAVVATSGPGIATGSVADNHTDASAPSLHSGEKINHTAVELQFVDESGVDTASIDASDFLLSNGELAGIGVTQVGSNASVVLSLVDPVDTDELTVGVGPGSEIQDVEGNTMDASDGPISVTIGGMDGIPPRAIGTNVTDARGSPARIEFNFDERLREIDVQISGPVNDSLGISDFENTRRNRYVATYEPPEDGEYTVVLVSATDRAGTSQEIGAVRTVTANRTKPSAVIGIDFATSDGRNITFDGSQSTGTDITYTWDFGDGELATGERVTHEFEPGIYTVTLEVQNGFGSVGTSQLELNLTDGLEPSFDGNGTGDSPVVRVDRDGGRSRSDAMVSVFNAIAERPVEVGTPDGDDPLVVHEGVALDALSVTPRSDLNFTLALSAAGPGSVADAERPGDEIVGGFTVVDNVPDESLESVAFTFGISRDRLDDTGVTPTNLTLRRQHNGSWESLDTTVVDETADRYRFSAVSPGFSRFALVGATGTADDGSESDATFDVADLQLNETTIQTGQTVGIETTVENTGRETAGFLAALAVDGTVVDTRTVASVPAGTTEAVRFSRQFDQAGEYTVSVNGTATSLTVEGGNDSTSDDAQNSDDGSDEQGNQDESSGDGSEADSGGESDESAGQSAEQFEVTDVEVRPADVDTGGEIEVTATVVNNGGETTDFLAALELDGEVVDTRPVPQVPPGEDLPVRFTRQIEEAGTYNVSVNGTASQEQLAVGQGGGGLFSFLGFLPLGFLPLGLLRTLALFVGLPIAAVYLVLKTLAIYLGY